MEKILSQYLRLLNIPISKQYCEKHIASHPDYPSLLSIADMLERLGIAYHAVRIKKQDLKQLPFPYLVQAKENGTLKIMAKQEDLKQVLHRKEKFSPFVHLNPEEKKSIRCGC